MSDESQPDYKDRTFVITASKDIRADDVDIKADTQVAVVTSPIGVSCLLGLINFHGFKVEEVTVGPDSQEEDSDPVDSEPAAVVEEVKPVEPEPVPAVDPVPTPEVAPDEVDAVAKRFQADGLDEKTSLILAEQKLTPEAVKELIAEDYDLTELEGIGETRATKILSVYPKTN